MQCPAEAAEGGIQRKKRDRVNERYVDSNAHIHRREERNFKISVTPGWAKRAKYREMKKGDSIAPED